MVLPFVSLFWTTSKLTCIKADRSGVADIWAGSVETSGGVQREESRYGEEKRMLGGEERGRGEECVEEILKSRRPHIVNAVFE